MNSRIATNCKACLAFKRWVTGSQSSNKSKEDPSSLKEELENHNECPLDTRELGIAAWSLLHSIAAYFPDNPTQIEREEIARLFEMIAKYYPCTICAKDFQQE